MKTEFKKGKNHLEITPSSKDDFKNNWVREVTGLKDWTNEKGETKKVVDGKFCFKNFNGKNWLYVCGDGIFQVCENGEKNFIQFANGTKIDLVYSEVMDFLGSALGQV